MGFRFFGGPCVGHEGFEDVAARGGGGGVRRRHGGAAREGARGVERAWEGESEREAVVSGEAKA